MKAPDAEPSVSKATLDEKTPLQRYGLAAVVVLIAFLIRLAIDPLVHKELPFATFIMATTVVAWYGGFGASLATLAAGFVLANWFFIEPRHQFVSQDFSSILRNVSTLLVGMTIVIFGRYMHLARARADANAREAIRHQKLLEKEVLERKRAEEAVRELNADLEKRVEQRTAELVIANHELESFTYSVSHDLRAPLRHMDGYAQILREEFGPQLPEEAQMLISKIRNGSENMGRLVDDLLNLSQIGKAELARRSTPLEPMVRDVVGELKTECAQRHVDWQIAPLPAVECDPGLVRQVFANLLANALKYTRPRDLARIEVGVEKADHEPAFFVRDNGVGFNMKYADKLFGVFQRLHRSEEFEGTGVGLATVARIVRKHGGKVWAQAELNHGATFFFTLGPSTNGRPVAAVPASS